MKKPILLGMVLGLLTVAGSAAAQYPPPPPPPGYGAAPAYGYPAPRPVQQFGGPGTLVISSDFNLGLSGQTESNNGPSTWTFTLAPAADYFVIQGLSIGGQIAYTHNHISVSNGNGNAGSTSTDVDQFGIGARVGYNIPINDLLSWWPKVGLIFTDQSTSGASGNAFDFYAYAPLLLHLAPHFFVGLGPGIQTDLSASASANGQSVTNPPKTTSYGLYFTIGGWTVPAG